MPSTPDLTAPTPPVQPLECNVTNAALVFEGGGMRGSYTAAVVATLIEEGIHFDHVSGVSAGSSHTLNYVSRDAARAHNAFVDIAGNPECGGMGHWLRGQGLFNVQYLYSDVIAPGGDLPFDWDTFRANPAKIQVGTFNASRGQQVWLGKEDMPTLESVGQAVRASSTLPILMPPMVIDDEVYYDGALGPNGGIALDAPMRDGYRKFVVILTRPRDYVKGGVRPALDAALRARFHDLPAVREGVLLRPARYNAARRRLFDLEKEGRAWVFAPERMDVSSTEMDVDKLEASFQAGMEQIQRELPSLREFLGI